MYYGAYYGRLRAPATVVVPPSPPTTPIPAPSTTNEAEPIDHVRDAVDRLLEQYKP